MLKILYKKILLNTASQIGSKIGTALISIVLLSLLTNYLPIALFGLYNKVYNYLGIFAFLADLGLYTITIREITHNKGLESKIVGNVLTLRTLLGITIIFLALGIGYFLPGYNSQLSLTSIAIVGVFTLISLINSSLLALMQSKMKIEFNLVSTIVGKALNLGIISIVVLFLFPKTNIHSFDTAFLWIMCAGLMGMLVQTGMNFIYASTITPIRFLFDVDYIRHIVKVTLPYGVALFLSVVYFKVDIILLSLIEPKEVADVSVALYSLPMKIVEVIMIVGGFYLSSILPSLTHGFSQKNAKKTQELVSFSFMVLFSLGVLIVVLGNLFSTQIIEVIATSQYIHSPHTYSSNDVFLIVLGVSFFFFLSSIFNYILIATKHESRILKINIFVTLVNIVGNCILIPYYSFMGSAMVTVFSQILLFILGFLATRDIIKLKWNYISTFLTLFVGGGVYSLGTVLVEKYDYSHMVEIVGFGTLLTVLYAIGVFFIYRKKIIEHFQQSHSYH